LLKLIVLAVLLFLQFGTTWACETNRMDLQITNIENVRGAFFVALHDSEHTYLNDEEESFQSTIVDVVKLGTQSVSLCNIQEGTYAIAVYQDENSNGELDSSFLRIPKEPYGFSNNLKKMLPPSFEEASFQFVTDDVIEIILK
jgi:uncharacterized protein (DUF2141 family)